MTRIFSRFDIKQLVLLILTAPLVIFSLGVEGLAKTSNRTSGQKKQKNSYKKAQTSSYRVVPQSEHNSFSTISSRPAILKRPVTLPRMERADEEALNSNVNLHFVATAYSIKNKTACGVMTDRGMIAADPKVIPLGSIVKIDAGDYSGTYRVLDTGGKVKGNKIDIYVPCPKEARRFGRREVKLEVIRYGWGTEKSRYLNRALARKQYDEEVFQELGTKEKELQK